MDLLRAPLHDANECGGDGKSMPSSKSNDAAAAPWLQSNTPLSPHDSGFAVSYQRIIYHHLCRMYVASQTMELGSESRFTGLVLFHRYARRFYCLVVQDRQEQRPPAQQQQSTTRGQQSAAHREEASRIKKHLGPVAAACLFLGCKMEEEPRRIRDVLNLSHLLNFSTWDDDEGGPSSDAHRKPREPETETDASLGRNDNEPITIVESRHPPPLDESYWTAKEQMVSTEQHVLRMIRFDTSVCHPYRGVLTVMETLGFGAGRGAGDGNPGDERAENWLLGRDQSENVISRAWRALNETSLDPQGGALKYPVVVLSCAAISLAAEGGVEGDDTNDDDGKKVTLPNFWWRALDVSTEDIMMAKEALQKVLL